MPVSPDLLTYPYVRRSGVQGEIQENYHEEDRD